MPNGLVGGGFRGAIGGNIAGGFAIMGGNYFSGKVTDGIRESLENMGAKLPGVSAGVNRGNGNFGQAGNSNGNPDFYLNLKTGGIEQIEGSEDLLDQGYIHLADDDASIQDILDAISEMNFTYVTNVMSPNGVWVDTKSAYTGWIMMQIYSPEIIGDILLLSITGVSS